jgi:hypothetical protein
VLIDRCNRRQLIARPQHEVGHESGDDDDRDAYGDSLDR